MNIRKFLACVVCVSSALWLAGCGPSKPVDDLTSHLKGWSCLYSFNEGWNPFDTNTFTATNLDHIPLALYQKNKVVLDDAQSFVHKLEASYGFSPRDTDQFFLVSGGQLYDDPSGAHAVKYSVDLKTKMFDTDYTYLLLYDQNNKRTNVIKAKAPHPSRGFGQIKTKQLDHLEICKSVIPALSHPHKTTPDL